jgi:hypothetical protein
MATVPTGKATFRRRPACTRMQSAEKKISPKIAIQAGAGWRTRKELFVEELDTGNCFPQIHRAVIDWDNDDNERLL